MTLPTNPPSTDQDSPAAPQITLRLLATSDLHAHVLPWDDLSDRPAPGQGLAQVASLVTEARAEVAGSLLLDNGDFLNGSPLADHIAAQGLGKRVHPMIEAMNQLGYDAATLGNHEFSNGLRFLRLALTKARFPVVATNLDRLSAGGRRNFLPRHVLIRRSLPDQSGQMHPVTIGVLGFLPPQTALWERRHLAGRLETRSILQAAKQAIPRLRRDGADVIVALAHSGLGHLTAGIEAENVALALAELDGIDAVIAGHTHQQHPATPQDATRALVMPGFFGSHLGVIDLVLRKTAAGWQRASQSAQLRPVARRCARTGQMEPLVVSDPAIAKLVAADVAAMRSDAARPIGQTKVPLHSYFALIGHCPIQTLLAEAQRQAMARALRGTPAADLPLLVAVAPFKAGGRGGPENFTAIPAGPLTARHISDLYIHPNSPVALHMTGDELALWLERSVSLFRQITPGLDDQPLINPDFPAYNFDMIHGLGYQIDLTQPAMFDSAGKLVNPKARRIVHLTYNGQPLLPEAAFVLATNSYRASGGAGFAGTNPARIATEESRPLRLILTDHVAQSGTLSPIPKADWGFLPIGNTAAHFDSSPDARTHATAIPGLSVIGQQPSGFLRFRLAL